MTASGVFEHGLLEPLWSGLVQEAEPDDDPGTVRDRTLVCFFRGFFLSEINNLNRI